MKRLLTVFLSVVLMLALVATAVASEDDKAAWASAIKEKLGGTEITALLASHPSTDAMLKMLDEFTALTGIKVNTKVLASGEMKTMQRSNSSTATGAFDVYMVDAFTIYEYAVSKWLEPLDAQLKDSLQTPEWFDYEDILLAFRNGIATVDGIPYALPIAGESRFIGYRTDLFEKYSKQAPKTLDELLELAAFFNGKEDGLYGIVFRGAPGTLIGSAHMAMAYCFTDDPIINHKTGEYQFNSPETVQSVQYILDLAKQGPPDIASYNHEDSAALFAQGKTAMWYDATSMAVIVENPETSQIVGKVSYFNIPDGPAGGSGAIAGWSLAVPTDAKNKEAAFAFCMYMTSRGMAKTYNLNGGIPCRSSVFEDEEIMALTPRNRFIYEAIKDAGRLVERGVVYNYASPYVLTNMKFIGDAVNRAVVGEITAQQAAEEAHTAIVTAIAETKK